MQTSKRLLLSALFASAALALTPGCSKDKADPDGSSSTSNTTTTQTSSCEPQAWPIDDEQHQVDRFLGEREGLPFMYWIPENPRAVFIIFHGSNRDILSLSSVEHEEFYNELARRNIGYFAYNGNDWSFSESPSNAGFVRGALFRDSLIASGELAETTPVFSAGFSGGCAFNAVFANIALGEGWDYRGFSCHVGATSTTAPVPSVFYAHENDDPQFVRNAHQDQLDAGQNSLLFDLAEENVDPMRFTKIINIDAQESQSWFDEMVDFGMLDADGARLVPDDDMEASTDFFENNSIGLGNSRATLQLKVLWRLHLWPADRVCQELDFFEKLL